MNARRNTRPLSDLASLEPALSILVARRFQLSALRSKMDNNIKTKPYPRTLSRSTLHDGYSDTKSSNLGAHQNNGGINALSNEMLSIMFCIASKNGHDYRTNLGISYTCARWRALFLETPSMWQNINLDSTPLNLAQLHVHAIQSSPTPSLSRAT